MTSRYTWILDPGHGGVDANGRYLTAGKRSPSVPPGIYEGEFNRDVARRVVDLCPGVATVITVPGPENLGLSERARFARRLHAERKNCIFISIHANAAGDGRAWNEARGATVFHLPGNAAGAKLAERLLDGLGEYTGLSTSRGVRQARFAVLARTVPLPGALVECGFMTNLEEAVYLASDEGRAAIARGLASVILDYEAGRA